MNKLENSVIKYQIDLERYKNGQANEIVKLLDNANLDIAKFVKQTKGVNTKARYKAISKKLHSVSEGLKNKVRSSTDIDGLIDYELAKEEKLFGIAKQYMKDADAEFIFPSREQIKTSALFKPVDTLTFDSYLNGIEAGLYNTWDSAVRTGYLTGKTTQQIVRDVMGSASQVGKLAEPGLMNSLRNSVYGNTRTLLQSFANETQRRVYEENEDCFGDVAPDGQFYRYEYLATLDSRTCLVCGSLGGKLYKNLEDVPSLPQHRGCRCVILPYFNTGGKMASKDGYVEKISFNDWLEKQNEETQKDVLGATRYEIYKNDKSSVKSFVDRGEVVPVNKLYENIGQKYYDNSNVSRDFFYTEQDIKAVDVTKRRAEINVTKKMTFAEKEAEIEKWIVTNGIKENAEFRVICDLDNNVLCITKGNASSVGYSDSALERSVFAKHKSNSLITYHNHLRDFASSYSDVKECVEISQYKESVIFTSGGKKFGLSRGALSESVLGTKKLNAIMKEMEYNYKVAVDSHISEMKQFIANGGTKQEEYIKNVVFSKTLNDEMMRKYGFIFLEYKR